MVNTIKRIAIKYNPEPSKVSPKLVEFSRWRLISEVNSQLDRDISPNSVHSWVVQNGFSISLPMVYEYARARKKALVDGVSMEHVLGIVGKPMVDKMSSTYQTARDKLKSEIDALDMIVQRGYELLKKNPDTEIAPKDMMAAIKLKNELTDGNHGFLTNFGMKHLRDIENAKYSLIIDHLLSYIPDNQKAEAIERIAEIEDNYYQTTDYYEEYLRASGDLTEDQIQRKLEIYKLNRSELQTVV